MPANLAHYEDLAQLEDDIISFLPTVTDMEIFGCEVELLQCDTKLPLRDPIHSALQKQSRLQMIVRPCMEECRSRHQRIGSSGSAAQFIKALTRMVCNAYGSLTSQRLVQCTKVNSWIFSMFVFDRSTCFSNLQLSRACAPSTWKSRVSSSVVIPVELRHPCGGLCRLLLPPMGARQRGRSEPVCNQIRTTPLSRLHQLSCLRLAGGQLSTRAANSGGGPQVALPNWAS